MSASTYSKGGYKGLVWPVREVSSSGCQYWRAIWALAPHMAICDNQAGDISCADAFAFGERTGQSRGSVPRDWQIHGY